MMVIPILVTLAGIVTDARFIHALKADPANKDDDDDDDMIINSNNDDGDNGYQY